jgi:hypothetical protein
VKPDWSALIAAAKPLRIGGELQRLVESQEQVATVHLVSTLARQELLEEMLESVKPPLASGSEKLHYLLKTPFRYPPLEHGSRFGGPHEPSLFYGSLSTPTVLAEAAYYRFVFWHGMTTPPAEKITTQHTLFGARYRTERGLKLSEPPFARYKAVLADPAEYRPTQALGSLLREAGIEGVEYVSARDPDSGVNVALFTPSALTGRRRPTFQDGWLCELTAEQVHFSPKHGKGSYTFPLTTFLVRGRLPEPAI